jgi:hypothetical protein
MSRAVQILSASCPTTGDTGGQWVFPKLGKLAKNAGSHVFTRGPALFHENARRAERVLQDAANQWLRGSRATGDTAVFGKDFGKIFGNKRVLSIAMSGYGSTTRIDGGGRRG